MPFSVFTQNCEIHENCGGQHVACYNASQHATANPETSSYSGYGNGVAFAQSIPADAQRSLTESFAADAVAQSAALSKKLQPGASATYQSQGSVNGGPGDTEPRHGYVLYAGTSVKGPVGAGNTVAEVPPSFEPAFAHGHSKNRRCAEPHVVSNYAYDHPQRAAASYRGNFYSVANSSGSHIPACGHSDPQIKAGCIHCMEYVGATDLGPERLGSV